MFQCRACELAKFSACIAKCMATINMIYFVKYEVFNMTRAWENSLPSSTFNIFIDLSWFTSFFYSKVRIADLLFLRSWNRRQVFFPVASKCSSNFGKTKQTSQFRTRLPATDWSLCCYFVSPFICFHVYSHCLLQSPSSILSLNSVFSKGCCLINPRD